MWNRFGIGLESVCDELGIGLGLVLKEISGYRGIPIYIRTATTPGKYEHQIRAPPVLNPTMDISTDISMDISVDISMVGLRTGGARIWCSYFPGVVAVRI